jgi:hypothetical protein
MHSITIKRTTAAAVAAVAIAGAVGAPTASARLPDDGTYTGVPAGGWPDMHASTAIAAAQAREKQEARLGGASRGVRTHDVGIIKVPAAPTHVSASSHDGMDWRDAGIGAGGTLAMVLLASGGAVAVTRRRRGGHFAPTG